MSKTTKFTDIIIEDYTEKSFVIRGDTYKYKESMLSLGGKWNSSLTDKSSDEKYGGWIFPMIKKNEVRAWQSKGVHLTSDKKDSFGNGSTGFNKEYDTIIRILKKLEENQETMMRMLGCDNKVSNKVIKKAIVQCNQEEDDLSDLSDDEPPKRLIGKK